MFKETIPAGESKDYRASGSWVRVDKGSRVSVMTDQGEKAPLRGRDSVQFKPFSMITITNQSNQAEEIELRVSGGRIVAAGDESVVRISDAGNAVHVENAAEIGAAVTFGGTINVGGVTIENELALKVEQTALSALPDNLVGLNETKEIAPTNTDRREVIVQVMADQETRLRIGPDVVANGRGLLVIAAPGVLASLTLNTTAAVYAYNESGDVANVSVLEIAK